MIVLWLALGGGVGAVVRDLLGQRLGSRAGIAWANRAGALVLGVLVGALASGRVDADVVAVVGTGFCGGLTTFSSLAVTAVEEVGGRWWATRETVVGIVLALVGWVGMLLA